MNIQWNSYTSNTIFNPLTVLILSVFIFCGCQDSLDSMSADVSAENFNSITASSPGHGALTMEVSETTGQEFKVFDATGFKGKPKMSHFGIRPMHFIYTNDLWKTKRTEENRWEFVSESMAAKNAKEADGIKGRAVMVDVQNWPTGKAPKTTKKSTSRLAALYYDLKRGEPNKNFGYFNGLPIKNWWTKPPSKKRLKIWRKKNDRLKKLAKKVDTFYLPGYTKSKDRERWVRNMEYLIEEARRIGNGQSIYLVLWPQYYNDERNYIEEDFWKKQLQTAKKYADGIVLWAPHGTPWNGDPWWNETKQFMEDLGEYAAEPKVSDSEFKIFDGTRFRDKPNMQQFGFKPLMIIYESRIWDKPMSKVGKWELPKKNLAKKWTNEAYERNKNYMMLNIERWPTKGSSNEVQHSIKQFTTVLDWVRSERPNMNVGYYSQVPRKLHWTKYPQKKWIKSVNETNKRLSPLADKVDVFYLSAYTRSKDQEGWLINTKYMIKQTNKYNGNKEVYLTLWPQYHTRGNSSLDGKYIGEDFWKLQLETARKYADGVVIWFPYRTKWSDAKSGPWWNETKRFLRDIGQAK